MNLSEYWKIFKEHGRVQHAVILILVFLFIVGNIIAIFDTPTFVVYNLAWIAIGLIVIQAVFKNLKKKAGLLTTSAIQRTGNVNTSETPAINTPAKRNFWNYFTLILFVLNIIIAIFVFPFSAGNKVGLEGLIFLIHYVLIFLSIPFVILALLGRLKIVANVISSLLLLPAPLFSLLVVFIKLINLNK